MSVVRLGSVTGRNVGIVEKHLVQLSPAEFIGRLTGSVAVAGEIFGRVGRDATRDELFDNNRTHTLGLLLVILD